MIIDVHGITLPKEGRFEDIPDLTISPMLAQDIGWVDVNRNVIEAIPGVQR
jgi:hypothetical protein